MTENSEDIDDFDIYADLDDNIDINFNETDNCFENYQNFSETGLSSVVTKTIETNYENNGIITEIQTQINDNIDFEAENHETSVGSVGQTQNQDKLSTEPSNDLILSEITILEKTLHKTEDINKTLIKQNKELKQQMKEKERQLTVLKTNISSLYKTAKAEIDRKKLEIHELREELDSMIFRRLSRNGIKADNSNKSDAQQNRSQTEDKHLCHKSCQTLDRDLRHNSNSLKKSPDTSVRSPKERQITDRRSRRSQSRNNQRTQRRSRSRSSRRNRNSPPKSSQKTRKSRSKSPQKPRKSRSKSPQKSRRSRSRSSQRNKKEVQRSPNKDKDKDKDRHRTNTETKSKTSPKRDDKKRKSDKSDAKPPSDPKRQISDKRK